MNRNRVTVVILVACFGACAAPAPTRQGASFGSRHTVRFQQPPDQAAACFGRNAEEHSSALVAEIRPGRDSAQVIVRVKNGTLYATADFQRAGSGSTGTIALNVTTTGKRNDLLDSLVEGC
jgi:hypothetical protein